MPPDPGPPLDDAFEALAVELVLGYVEATGTRLDWVAGQILELRWQYFGGNLATWTADEVRRVLFDLYPANSTLSGRGPAEVIEGFAGFLRYLGDIGLAPLPTMERLADLVEANLEEFEAAMADESRWSASKRLLMAMKADGVDLMDEAAVGAWMEAFNASSFEERVRIVGP